MIDANKAFGAPAKFEKYSVSGAEKPSAVYIGLAHAKRLRRFEAKFSRFNPRVPYIHHAQTRWLQRAFPNEFPLLAQNSCSIHSRLSAVHVTGLWIADAANVTRRPRCRSERSNGGKRTGYVRPHVQTHTHACPGCQHPPELHERKAGNAMSVTAGAGARSAPRSRRMRLRRASCLCIPPFFVFLFLCFLEQQQQQRKDRHIMRPPFV